MTIAKQDDIATTIANMKAAISSILLSLPACHSLLGGAALRGANTVPNPATSIRQRPTNLNLVPLSKFANDCTFLNESENIRCCIDTEGNFKDDDSHIYELGLIDEEDLSDLSRFVIAAFGADGKIFWQ